MLYGALTNAESEVARANKARRVAAETNVAMMLLFEIIAESGISFIDIAKGKGEPLHYREHVEAINTQLDLVENLSDKDPAMVANFAKVRALVDRSLLELDEGLRAARTGNMTAMFSDMVTLRRLANR